MAGAHGNITASQMENPSPLRKQILRPVAAHAAAGANVEALSITPDPDGHARGTSRDASPGGERDFALLCRRVEYRLIESRHVLCSFPLCLGVVIHNTTARLGRVQRGTLLTRQAQRHRLPFPLLEESLPHCCGEQLMV